MKYSEGFGIKKKRDDFQKLLAFDFSDFRKLYLL